MSGSAEFSSSLPFESELAAALAAYVQPEELGFGRVMAPAMFSAHYSGGEWKAGNFEPFRPLEISPAAKALHYAQQAFEGHKAYRVDKQPVSLFRPRENWKRLARSARHLCLPQVPESLYMDAVFGVSALNANCIPRDSGESLYLRPFIIATEGEFGMGASSEVAFMVIASPSAAYHPGSMKVLIERQETRVASGAIGSVKVGGNYASALHSAARCADAGFDLSLWLDPVHQRFVDELSGMNFFAVVDGELLTPSLGGSILPGITRDTIMRLAMDRGYRVRETQLPIDELLRWISSGRCSECFACGTAAIVAPISVLGEANGQQYELNPDRSEVAAVLRKDLLDIQEGRVPDRHGWVERLPDRWAGIGH